MKVIDPEVQPKSFKPKALLIWLAILALILGLVVSQSGTPTPSAGGPESIDDLLKLANEERITEAKIQSDPKGGDEWYVIQGNFLNSGFDPESHENNNHKALPFVVKGRVTESEYKELREALGKTLKESPSSTLWTDVFFSLLPILLILGFLYFTFNRLLDHLSRIAGPESKEKVLKLDEKDRELQPKSFKPKALLIWLAILALIIGLVVSQSNTPVPTADSPGSVDDLLTYAKDGRIAKAVIQSDPKGGDEWYVIQGNFLNSGFDPESHENNNHKALPFVVKGRVTESEYKELREALGKTLKESPSSTLWTDVFFSLLPILLILGFLYFTFKRLLNHLSRIAGPESKEKVLKLDEKPKAPVRKDPEVRPQSFNQGEEEKKGSHPSRAPGEELVRWAEIKPSGSSPPRSRPAKREIWLYLLGLGLLMLVGLFVWSSWGDGFIPSSGGIDESDDPFTFEQAKEDIEAKEALRLIDQGTNDASASEADTLYKQAEDFFEKGEYDKAIAHSEQQLAIYLKALGPDHPDVATTYNNIGLAYREKGEYDKAIGYHEKSLAIKLKALGPDNPDVATSYNNIGAAYDSKGDKKEAFKWYTKSAEQGNAYGQLSLGYCYYNGRGVPEDNMQAVKWYTKSAEQGLTDAQGMVGVCYHHGLGVAKNLVEGYAWYNIAIANGNEDFKDRIKKIELTPKQLVEVQALSTEIYKRIEANKKD